MKSGSHAKFRLKRSLQEISPNGKAPEEELVPFAITLIDHASRRIFQSSTKTEVDHLPYHIGRQSRSSESSEHNDYSVKDQSPYQVSRVHCSLEYQKGKLIVRDRGSSLGTSLNSMRLGKESGVWCAELLAGDNTLVLGPEDSLFRFVVRVEAAD